MTANTSTNHTTQELLYNGVENIDKDQEFWFQLRGANPNILIDVATPLLGLSLRVKTLSDCSNIDDIYRQTIEEITTIEIELTENGYDHAVIMAYRYILCAFLDEAVMGTAWGSASIWAEHSMLSRFHDETWGGEKVFSILSRLENEPKRYKNLLEFIFHCLILGFEGKYGVVEKGAMEREKVIRKLYEQLKILDDESAIRPLSSATNHVVQSKYKLRHQIPIWSVFAIFILICCGIFAGYSYFLHSKSADVLNQLNQLL